jgi:hypothetical protein
MGVYHNDYISAEDAKKRGFRHAEYAVNNGDVALTFENGRIWMMPNTILLYVELGWKPPQKFIEDIMNGKLVERAPMDEITSADLDKIMEDAESGKNPISAEERAEFFRSASDFLSGRNMPLITNVGYIGKSSSPIPEPFGVHPDLPPGFLQRLEEKMNAGDHYLSAGLSGAAVLDDPQASLPTGMRSSSPLTPGPGHST